MIGVCKSHPTPMCVCVCVCVCVISSTPFLTLDLYVLPPPAPSSPSALLNRHPLLPPAYPTSVPTSPSGLHSRPVPPPRTNTTHTQRHTHLPVRGTEHLQEVHVLENANADLEDISRVKDEEKMQMTTNIKKLEGEKEALLKERSVSLPRVWMCGANADQGCVVLDADEGGGGISCRWYTRFRVSSVPCRVTLSQLTNMPPHISPPSPNTHTPPTAYRLFAARPDAYLKSLERMKTMKSRMCLLQ